MCSARRTIVELLLVALISMTLSAPVAHQSNTDEIKAALQSQIQQQEQELESLSSLGGKGHRTNGIEVMKSKSFSYSNINGAENTENETEEAVSDPISEKLISDIKEKLSSKQSSPDSEPETEAKAVVEIPEAGIHKEIIQDGEQEAEVIDVPEADTVSEEAEQELEEIRQLKDTIEFTPQLVAEYLVNTGDVEEFRNLLKELVETSEITEDQAQQYEKNVMEAVDAVMQEEALSNENTYPDVFDNQPMYPGYNQLPYQQQPQFPEDVYSLYGMERESEKAEDEMKMNAYINYLLNRPVSLDEMIGTLLDDWLTRAIITGEPEAEAILNNIIEFVSKDDNPKDEEQVKAILGDIFAESLLEDMTPRIEPESLPSLVMPIDQAIEQPQEESLEVADGQTVTQTESEESTDQLQQSDTSVESQDEPEERLQM